MPDPGVTRAKPPRKELRSSVQAWEDFVAESQRIKARMDEIAPPPRRVPDPGNFDEYERLKNDLEAVISQRERERDEVIAIVKERPRLKDEAIAWGFKEELLTEGVFEGSTDPDRQPEGKGKGKGGGTDDASKQGTGTGTKTPKQPPPTEGFKDRLGKKGDYTIIKRDGQQFALYTYNFGGNKVEIALRIPKGKEDRYGVKPGDGINVTDQRWGRIEVIGSADELPLGGLPKDALKETQRYLQRVYGSSPVTDDDEVMAVFIGAEMLGWTPEEIAGGLRRTTWFKGSTEWERHYVRDFSPEQRREQIRDSKQDVIQGLEDLYGMNWMDHLKEAGFKNPMKDINEWARQIASGEMGGDPGKGLERFLRRHDVKAREIEGTPAYMAWQSEQEALAAYANRPEDEFERVRAEALDYLGQDKNQTPRLDRSVLKQWANDLVSGTKSDHDWQEFLRDSLKRMFPYFDRNASFTSQASPFKSILERTIGDTVDWSDNLLRDFSQLDDSGKPTGQAMSLRDFELMVRDPLKNPRAYSEGTPLFDQGMNKLAGLVRRLRGGG